MRSLPHVLDDWVDGHPDAWDYVAVLFDHGAHMSFDLTYGWSMSWEHGTIGVGLPRAEYELARKGAAVFIEMWLRGVSASFAVKLMEGFILREKS